MPCLVRRNFLLRNIFDDGADPDNYAIGGVDRHITVLKYGFSVRIIRNFYGKFFGQHGFTAGDYMA